MRYITLVKSLATAFGEHGDEDVTVSFLSALIFPASRYICVRSGRDIKLSAFRYRTVLRLYEAGRMLGSILDPLDLR